MASPLATPLHKSINVIFGLFAVWLDHIALPSCRDAGSQNERHGTYFNLARPPRGSTVPCPFMSGPRGPPSGKLMTVASWRPPPLITSLSRLSSHMTHLVWRLIHALLLLQDGRTQSQCLHTAIRSRFSTFLVKSDYNKFVKKGRLLIEFHDSV